ncbi:hypothetical protein PACILC2_48630 [Paenibacillus cisolokensis]|uniref:Uncharacterized protein n=1 Tax=Paenibacillus cisolokensis TaxID=1658519 RepID=A0ABQ4NDN7_9BACL|nr:hypothetical protein [Paenibacillus cisolokensis]GIQ66295.1 hypothetical protein PACILC2_48630 [Paenibacillus cisolokensis]
MDKAVRAGGGDAGKLLDAHLDDPDGDDSGVWYAEIWSAADLSRLVESGLLL